jgi:hypothetical protein
MIIKPGVTYNYDLFLPLFTTPFGHNYLNSLRQQDPALWLALRKHAVLHFQHSEGKAVVFALSHFSKNVPNNTEKLFISEIDWKGQAKPQYLGKPGIILHDGVYAKETNLQLQYFKEKHSGVLGQFIQDSVKRAEIGDGVVDITKFIGKTYE